METFINYIFTSQVSRVWDENLIEIILSVSESFLEIVNMVINCHEIFARQLTCFVIIRCNCNSSDCYSDMYVVTTDEYGAEKYWTSTEIAVRTIWNGLEILNPF
jgi:hypothetical protein